MHGLDPTGSESSCFADDSDGQDDAVASTQIFNAAQSATILRWMCDHVYVSENASLSRLKTIFHLLIQSDSVNAVKFQNELPVPTL
jgi:hypothetical protein